MTEYIDFAKARVDSRIYIFLDEISFVKEWQRALKELADSGHLRNILLLLTGSNILDIKFSNKVSDQISTYSDTFFFFL